MNHLDSAYEKLREKMEIHRIEFIKRKSCVCNILTCRHYYKERDDLFSGVINEIFRLNVKEALKKEAKG